MIRRTLLIASSLLLCGLALVQAAPVASAPPPSAPAAPVPDVAADSGLSTTLTESYVSQYWFRGIKLGGNAMQSDAEISLGSFDLDLWASAPLRQQDKVPGQSDPEFVITPQYTVTLVKDVLSIPAGITIYDYPRAPLSDGFYRSTYEPFIGVSYTVVGVTLAPKAYYDLVMHGPTYEVGAAYTVPLKALSTELDLSAAIGTFTWHDEVNSARGPLTKEVGSYWQVGVIVPVQISKPLALNLGYTLNQGVDQALVEGRHREYLSDATQGYLTIQLAYTF